MLSRSLKQNSVCLWSLCSCSVFVCVPVLFFSWITWLPGLITLADITMEPLHHLSTQSSANRHNQHTRAYCSHTERKKKRKIDCRLYSLPLKPQLLSNIHPHKVCHLILCGSADTARWRDFLFLHSFLPPSHIYTHSPLTLLLSVSQSLTPLWYRSRGVETTAL